MIELRGHNDVPVVTGSAVPVADISDAVLDRKNLDWICNRYPVTVLDVFECIEFLADLHKSYESGITLYNKGTDNDIQIETISVNETMFFNLLDFGHSIDPGCVDFDKIYNTGLVTTIREIYSDIRNGIALYESSEFHVCVYDALYNEIGDIDPDEILSNLSGE